MRSELLDVPGAADYLSVTERWIRSQVFKRQIPFVKLGTLVRFERAALDQFIAESRVPIREEVTPLDRLNGISAWDAQRTRKAPDRKSGARR
jgi:excisionase family DNA binding protein